MTIQEQRIFLKRFKQQYKELVASKPLKIEIGEYLVLWSHETGHFEECDNPPYLHISVWHRPSFDVSLIPKYFEGIPVLSITPDKIDRSLY